MTAKTVEGASRSHANLISLPAELLYDIHLLSVSSTLPLVTRRTLVLFKDASNFHRAGFLWRDHHLPSLSSPKISPPSSWDAQLRYPCCGLEVLELIRMWEEKEGRKVRIRELPKRLFRYPSNPNETLAPQTDPLILALLRPPYSVSPDRKGGFPLSRAVLARDLVLMRALLDVGADPGIKEALPVRVAVGKGDLDVVRMLVEPEYVLPEESERVVSDPSTSSGGERSVGSVRRRRTASPGKRRKVEDRLKVTDGMLEAAMKRGYLELAQWLMSKGAVPTMQTLRLLETQRV